MQTQAFPTHDDPAPPPVRLGWFVAPVFFGLAGWFSYVAPPTRVPAPPAVLVAAKDVLPGARRFPMHEPPTVAVGGFDHRCNECHKIFQSPLVQHRPLMQHTHIMLRHGMNDNCFNCHDRKNREKLVLYSGQTIGFAEVPRLCAQCHGTVFRDWQRGTHGKTLGSWDRASGAQVRLDCNDCHDPHAPAYPPFVPLPPPRTLRMGDPKSHDAAHDEHLSPLQGGAARAHEPPAHEEHP